MAITRSKIDAESPRNAVVVVEVCLNSTDAFCCLMSDPHKPDFCTCLPTEHRLLTQQSTRCLLAADSVLRDAGVIAAGGAGGRNLGWEGGKVAERV